MTSGATNVSSPAWNLSKAASATSDMSSGTNHFTATEASRTKRKRYSPRSRSSRMTSTLSGKVPCSRRSASRSALILSKSSRGKASRLMRADVSPLRPESHIDRAEALQWMFFEQHSIEPNLGAAYFWLALVKGGRDLQQHALEDWMEEGNRALGVMENHLEKHRFFVADRYSVADIALYAYTHLAHECDFDLAPFPAIRAWLDRVAAQPRHVPMDWQPQNVAAAE